MEEPCSDPRIQPALDLPAPALVPGADAGRDTPTPSLSQRGGLLFGAFVGLALGALTGAACCWLADTIDYFGHGVVVGAGLGTLAGAILGHWEARRRGMIGRPDAATHTGALFGLLPGLQAVLMGIGGVGSRLSGFLLIAAFFVGPSVGCLLGALFDRAYESLLNRCRGQAAWRGLLAVAIAVSAAWYLAANPAGDTDQLAREVRLAVYQNWRDHPTLHEATSTKVTLSRLSDRVYTGFLDARIHGIPEHFRLKVTVNGSFFRYELEPVDIRP
jgi:hypothetical protein